MKFKLLRNYASILNLILNFCPFFYINVFYDNMTYFGNSGGHYFLFFLWTLSSCFGYYFYSKKIWEVYKIKYESHLHTLFIVGIILSIFIPYSSSLPGWINDGHVWLAIVCIAGFMLEWLWISLHSTLQYTKEWKGLFCIFMFCLFLLLLFGHVTAIAEITFSSLVNLYLSYWLIKKEVSL